MNETATASRPGSAKMQGDLWSVRARDYADLQERQFRPLYESVLQRPEIAGARSSLDVGCGPGLAAQVFAQKIAEVSGVDASAAFIDIARQRLPGRDFRVGEMEALPYPDDDFDVVTGFNAFQYAASPITALGEARRVLRPGGAIVIATWGLPEDCEAAGHLKALGALMPPPPPGAPARSFFQVNPSSRPWRPRLASHRSPWSMSHARGSIRTSIQRCAACCPPALPNGPSEIAAWNARVTPSRPRSRLMVGLRVNIA